MLPPDLISCFIAPLEEEGFEYLVSGSVATSLLGEPRFTADIDIALFLNPAQIFVAANDFSQGKLLSPTARCDSDRMQARHSRTFQHHSS